MGKVILGMTTLYASYWSRGQNEMGGTRFWSKCKHGHVRRRSPTLAKEA